MPVSDHIDNVTRLAEFNPGVTTTTFPLTYPVYEADDDTELKSDFLVVKDAVVQTAFTVTGTFLNGVSIDAAIVFSPGITGNLKVYSRRRPRSALDLASGRGVTPEEFNAIFNSILASLRDTYDWLASSEAGNVLPTGTFVPTAGGSMSGFLSLVADPASALHAATKQYVDSINVLTTKGDLVTRTATVNARLPVGANNQRLVADSAQTSGLRWDFDGAPEVVLTDAATITWNLSSGRNFVVTLAGNRTLAAFTGGFDGQEGYLRVVQDGTGNRTLNLSNAVYDFSGGTATRPSLGAGEATVYHYRRISSGSMLLTRMWAQGFNSIGFWKEYDKGTYAVSTKYTQAHGLAQQPAAVLVWLENTVTDLSYAVGDRILMAASVPDPAGNVHFSVMSNTTNVIVNQAGSRVGAASNASPPVNSVLASASWKVIIRVYE